MGIREILSVSSIGTNELQHGVIFSERFPEVAFSFLYRNERTATPRMTCGSFCAQRFQFPLSERTNCNVWRPRPHRFVSHPFSFLYRNERTATEPITADLRRHKALSVSSIGTNELQRLSTFRNTLRLGPFSFLYRNERTATISPIAPPQPVSKLSVSSIGTNELQRFFLCGVSCQFQAFSFLYRNERTATNRCCRNPYDCQTFQFPLSERTNCNP